MNLSESTLVWLLLNRGDTGKTLLNIFFENDGPVMFLKEVEKLCLTLGELMFAVLCPTRICSRVLSCPQKLAKRSEAVR